MRSQAVIGHVHCNLGPKVLRDLAQHTLYWSFESLSMLGGGFFKVIFAEEEGRMHTLAKQHHIKLNEIFFTPWRPNFNPKTEADGDTRLINPMWVQIHGLPTLLQTPQILVEIVNQFAKVIRIVTENQYRDMAARPRVCILVSDSDALPSKVNIPDYKEEIAPSTTSNTVVPPLNIANFAVHPTKCVTAVSKSTQDKSCTQGSPTNRTDNRRTDPTTPHNTE